jgi:hypothetical protein
VYAKPNNREELKMSLTSFAEIKTRIAESLPEFQASAHPEDLLNEYAESECPIMNHEIIKEWTEMPHEFDDSWQQYGMDEYFWQGGIVRLMSIDLLEYYKAQFAKAWAEVSEQETTGQS